MAEAKMDKELRNLFSAYYRADANLTAAHNRLFPPGTRVRCTFTDSCGTVKEGSLYADQVNTDRGYMGWRWLEKVEETHG